MSEIAADVGVDSEAESSAVPAVRLSGVKKRYREGATERTVLSSATATIAPGEFVVLIGKSGSGKSTLLNIVAGIDVPSEGTVEVHGCSLGTLSEEERTLFRRRRVGFVFQTFNLIPTLTALENLMLPLELIGDSGAAALSRARQMLEQIGLGGRGGSYPDTLSGGEQQRVAVARALVHDPWLVLADEPTGDLDEETGTEVLNLLDELTRKRSRTLLLVTHDRDIVARADRALLLDHGALVTAPGEPPR
jgi:putative ABC transport system ATP-binding protein